jgi:RNA polymerase sigma-70 factor (ECF subfamily)
MDAITGLMMSSLAGEGEALARTLRERDPDALDLLIGLYHYRLLRYLLYLTRNRETAEDIFQETWIRVLERGHQYNGKMRFETWLFAIARHLLNDRLRRERPRVSLESLLDPDDVQPSVDFAFSGASLAPALIAQKEEGDRLVVALERLPAACREAIMLRYQEDLSLEEIAAISSAPLSTVKSRIYRGLELLRGSMNRGQP